MKRLLLVAMLLASTSALAADNAIVLTPCVSSCVVERTVDTTGAGGPQSPMVVLGSSTGTAIYGTPGAPNTTSVISVQGVASGTALTVNQGAAGAAWPVTQSGGPWSVSGTVTANQGTPPWTVNPGTAALWGVQAQGSSTPGQSGVLNQAAVVAGTPTYTATQTSPLTLDTGGNLRVNVVTGGAGGGAVTVANGADVTQGATGDSACGTAIGNCSAIALLKFLNTAVSGPLPTQASTVPIGGVGLLAGSSGGCTPGHLLVQTGSVNLTQIKGTAGTLCWMTVIQTGTSTGFLKLYDSASLAACSGGTVVANLPIQSNATSPGMVVPAGPYGLAFQTGIAFCLTNVVTDNDTTPYGGATNSIVINYAFK
jgi:hypothetical protein